MEILIVPGPKETGLVVADVIVGAIEAGATTLGLATGSSPLAAYAELARRYERGAVSFAGLQAYLLDEYVGLAADHPQAYAHFIQEHLVGRVDLDPDRVHGPDGATPDVLAEAARYEAAIAAAGPVDVQVLGIGANGHIGFNEPSSSLTSRTRIKTLTAQTRRDNARFFGSLDEVPHHVITQGLGTICEARHLVLTASGSHKAAAVAAAVEGPLSASCPASVLQWHPHATVVVDEAAAADLRADDFYRYVREHKIPGQGY